MAKNNYNDRLIAILSYLFVFHLVAYIFKNRSSFVKKHIKKGMTLNIMISIWLILVVTFNRLILLVNSFNFYQVINIILLIINIIISLLVIIYQVYSVRKIIIAK